MVRQLLKFFFILSSCPLVSRSTRFLGERSGKKKSRVVVFLLDILDGKNASSQVVRTGGRGGMDRARVRDEVSPGEIYEHPSRGGG